MNILNVPYWKVYWFINRFFSCLFLLFISGLALKYKILLDFIYNRFFNGSALWAGSVIESISVYVVIWIPIQFFSRPLMALRSHDQFNENNSLVWYCDIYLMIKKDDGLMLVLVFVTSFTGWNCYQTQSILMPIKQCTLNKREKSFTHNTLIFHIAVFWPPVSSHFLPFHPKTVLKSIILH